jgi:hypothetical protein
MGKEVITATVYGMKYEFKLTHEDNVEFSRGELMNHFNLSEVSRIDHVYAPLIRFHGTFGSCNVSEMKASDVMMRLHLIMPGDLCKVVEMVVFVGAGLQQSVNYVLAR